MPYTPLKVTAFTGEAIQIKSTNGYKHDFIPVNTMGDLYFPSKITSTTNDEVRYYYGKRTTTRIEGLSSNISYYYEALPELDCSSGVCFFTKTKNAYNDIQGQLIARDNITLLPDSIVSDSEVITFQFDLNPKNIPTYRLSKIVIKDKISGNEIKKILFRQTHFGSLSEDNFKLRLDKVVFFGSDNRDSLAYELGYNGSSSLPKYPSVGNGWVGYNDYWGYYNGSEKLYQLPNLLSSLNIPHLQPSVLGDYTPDASRIQSSILNRITYPTGGRTEFTYKSNCEDGLIGGVRISEIKSYDNISGNVVMKKYRYFNPRYRNVVNEFSVPLQKANYAYYIGPEYSPLITYTSYNVGNSYFSSVTNPNGTNVMFGEVEETVTDGSRDLGKKVYFYTTLDDNWYNYSNPNFIAVEPGAKHNYLNDYGNYTPKLDSILTYSFRQGSGYGLVQAEYNTYAVMKSTQFSVGLGVASRVNIVNFAEQLSLEQAFEMYNSDFSSYTDKYTPSLEFYDAIGHIDKTVLTGSQKVNYDLAGTAVVSSLENYAYDGYLQVSEKNMQTSKGEAIKTTYKYPYDGSFIQEQPYNTMVNGYNMLTPVVQTTESKGSFPIRTTHTSYQNWNNGIFAPNTVSTKNGDNINEVRMRYLSYDTKGNPLEIKIEKGISQSYYWSYKQSYPVVKAENISNKDLITKVQLAAANSGLNTNTWIKDPILEKEKWQSFNSLLRIYCGSDGRVTTYTYKPLVGMTSETDVKGRTTYYDHDGFGRLQFIRDHDKNVIKRFCYNYAGQTIDCGPVSNFSNTAMNQSFRRNTCSGNYSGSLVTYTVAAGKYSSSVSQADADAKAQAEISANGQSYANQVGSCTLCSGSDSKMINGVCVTATKTYTRSIPYEGKFKCYFNLSWPDGSKTTGSELSSTDCMNGDVLPEL